jgi:two-component system sensor histidine kinase KdpD
VSAILDGLSDRSGSLLNNDISAAHLRRRTQWMSFVTANTLPTAVALVLVWLTTIGLDVLGDFVSLKFVVLVYMLPVIGVAMQWGIVPALVAAIAGAAAADFFFIPPLYSFWIRNPENVVDLVLFLFVAVVTSSLAARLKSETQSSSLEN